MVKVNFEGLEFQHLVVYQKDATIFIAARDGNSGRLKLFLVHRDTGNAYCRNGRAGCWEELAGIGRRSILSRLHAARQNNIPVFEINESYN